MAKPKLYAINLDTLKIVSKTSKRLANLSGQAALVMRELLRDTTPRLAEKITEAIGDKMSTVQNPNRVTVYYLIEFAKLGILKTSLSAIDSGDFAETFAKKFGVEVDTEALDDDDTEIEN